MAKRSAHLVGSLPFDDDATCMRRALDALGPHLRTLPDGEIGEKSARYPKGNRYAWVTYAIELLTADGTNWKVVKQAVRGDDGLAIDYDHFQKLKPLRSPAEVGERVSFGYDRWVRTNYPIFQSLRRERGLDAIKFQLGLPTGSALGFSFRSPITALRYASGFNSVFAREANAARDFAGDDIVLQIEVPPELYFAYLLPKPLMGLALRSIHDLLGKIRPGAEIGVHLCLGDFHDQAIIHPKTLDRMVAFSNRLAAEWPSSHRLAYVHYPLAEGALPPPTDAAYYRPLGAVRLPAGTRFIGGFVHERLSPEDNRRVRDAIEQARGAAIDVACSCGLGRKSVADAERALALTRELIED